ncbi:MAG: T9SS type A sorting domain-containing protein [Bacteroidetes bacterium]|nr:MAG: T9SS type A sorting domain-containing protein [Bacteroidota bacterium]
MRSLLLAFLIINSFSFLNAQIYGWEPRGIGGGGAFYAPSINPANNNEYYVSSDMSGMYHTSDFGKSYNLIDFRTIQGSTNTFVRFTNVPNLLYALKRSGDSLYPAKSTNNGSSWTMLPGNPIGVFDEPFYFYVDYNNPSRIILSSYTDIYFSGDGGNRFKNIHTSIDGYSGIVIGGVFFDGYNIYIGTNDGLIVSRDGGIKFLIVSTNGIPENEKIYSFAGAREGTRVRLFCITGVEPWGGIKGSDYYNFAKGIYSLDIGTNTWTSKSNGLDFIMDFPMYISTAENNISTVYIAGSNFYGTPSIMKSTNDGVTWNETFLTNNNQNIYTGWCGDGGDRDWTYAECVFGFVVAPNDPNHLVFTDYGFVHTSSDGGTTWHEAYTSTENPAGQQTPKGKSYRSIGLENTSCWQVYCIDENNLFAAFSDIRGLRSTDGGDSWSFDYTGLTANTVYRITGNQNNSIIYAGTSDIHDLYQSTYIDDKADTNDTQGKIIYSTDKGASWSDLHYFGHPVFWVAMDPSNPNRMYASVVHSTQGGIYVTDDLDKGPASTWTKLPNPPRTQGHPATVEVLNDGTVVCTYSGRIVNGQFTASSGCFTYNPTTQQWTDVSHPDMYYWCKDVVVDSSIYETETWYVGIFSGWGGSANGKGGLLRTRNRGIDWIKTSNLDRVTSVTHFPGFLSTADKNDKEKKLDWDPPESLFLSTEINGLFLEYGSNQDFEEVDNYPFRQPERIFINNNPYSVWVANFGAGIMYIEIPTSVEDVTNYSENKIIISPNPASELVKISLKNIEETKLQIKIYDVLGNEIKAVDCGNYDNEKPVTIDTKQFHDGIYYVRAITNKRIFTTNFVIMR